MELRGTRSHDQVVKRVPVFRKLAVAPSLQQPYNSSERKTTCGEADETRQKP